MMCHKIGYPPISTIGFGFKTVSSPKRVPNPPASINTFIAQSFAVQTNDIFYMRYNFLVKRAFADYFRSCVNKLERLQCSRR